MVNAIKKGLIFGGILAGIIGIFQLIIYFFCNNIGCIGFEIMFFSPGLMVSKFFNNSIRDVPLVILNLFLFFLVGFVVGFVFGLIGERSSTHTTFEPKTVVKKEEPLKVDKQKDKITIKR